MRLFDLFKKNNNNSQSVKKEENLISDQEKIKVGQTLYANNGEKVILRSINEKTIVVEYKNKNHERDKGVIDKSLFIYNPLVINPTKLDVELKDTTTNEKSKIQENEKKKQEQIKVLKRQQEESTYRELAIKKRQEERKLQEQLNIQYKENEKLRIQEKIRMKEKDEEQFKLQEKARINKIIKFEQSGGFIRNLTFLYHDIFGAGIFVEFDSKKEYITVKFNTKSHPIIFVYPDSIGTQLFLQKTDKALNREEFLRKTDNKNDDIEEQLYFADIIEIVDKLLRVSKDEHNMTKYGYNDFSDGFDPGIHKKRAIAYKELESWRQVRMNPYFGRVDYGENSSFYIGKTKIYDLVVDWRDSICNLYYQYNIYIGNSEHNVSLVRDFEIVSGNYNGFVDKYSLKLEDFLDDLGENIISDEFLIKIIKLNRSDKNTHDIIQTIQKNQYEIITHNAFNSILVLGCAGSGKTMIMLHRLSYMIFNNTSIKEKDIYIISPTKLLNLENDELSKTLNINMVNRLSLKLFNLTLIEDYYKQNNLYTSIKFVNVTSNSSVNNSLINSFYEECFINTFKQNITSIFLLESTNRKEFISAQETRILEEYSDFSYEDTITKNISYEFIESSTMHESYMEIKEVVSKIPFQNAIHKINSIRGLLNSPKIKDQTLSGKKELLENLINDWVMSETTIYNNDGEVSIADEIFNEVFGYFNVLGTGNKNNKNISGRIIYPAERYINTFELINSYKEFIEKVYRFRNFVSGNNLNYLSEVIIQLISDIKKDKKINSEKIYEFELFFHLIGCNTILNSLNDKKKIIFVDEFQDYSNTELDLYKKIFPNAIFNLFGDINQSINPKGLNKNEMIKIVGSTWQKFSINENYRNAHQITKFINTEFKIDMTPIGIKGLVNDLDLTYFKSKIKLDLSDRIAFIIKDISIYEDINAEYSLDKINKVNLITSDECEIKRGFLNVIPVLLVKGLEFEQVYVFPNQMTQNEKYVAYTRALNKLYVLNLNE